MLSRRGFQTALVSTRSAGQSFPLTFFSATFAHISEALALVGSALTLVGDALTLVCDVLAVVSEHFSPVGDPFLCLQVLPLHVQRLSLGLAQRCGAFASSGHRLALVGDPLSLGSHSFPFLSDPLALAR